jgi:hypothetical protein
VPRKRNAAKQALSRNLKRLPLPKNKGSSRLGGKITSGNPGAEELSMVSARRLKPQPARPSSKVASVASLLSARTARNAPRRQVKHPRIVRAVAEVEVVTADHCSQGSQCLGCRP